MTRVVFWDVDTQRDFMLPDGKLYVPRAEQIIPRLAALTAFARQHGIRVVASAEWHQPDDAELSDRPDYAQTFPPHCLAGTPGAERIPETAPANPLIIEPTRQSGEQLAARVHAHSGEIVLRKRHFDVFSNPNADLVVRALAPTAIVVYGAALDICIRDAVEGMLARWPHTRLYAVTDAMKAIRYEVGEHLLRDWGDEGVRLVKTVEIVEDGVLTS